MLRRPRHRCLPILKAAALLLLALAAGGRLEAVDAEKISLVLTDRVAPGEPPEFCHHVSYPPDAAPASLENLFWIVEDPKGERKAFEMHKTGLHVRTPVSGTYRVCVEYHGADKPLLVSNVAEIKIAGMAAAEGANAAAAADKAKPLSEFLIGTKWLWYGRAGHVIEFRKDGSFAFDDWTQQGLEAGWETTGPSQVTITILSDKFKGRTAILDFSDDRGSFTGSDLDPTRTISKSPRVEGVDR